MTEIPSSLLLLAPVYFTHIYMIDMTIGSDSMHFYSENNLNGLTIYERVMPMLCSVIFELAYLGLGHCYIDGMSQFTKEGNS